MQYVRGLAHNLLSVCQLLTKGYSVVFKDDKCIINKNHTSNHIITITRLKNNIFPLDIASVEYLNVAKRDQASEELWHVCLGHLNYRSLMSLAHKQMVR